MTGVVWGSEGLEGLAKLVPLQDPVSSPATVNIVP